LVEKVLLNLGVNPSIYLSRAELSQKRAPTVSPRCGEIPVFSSARDVDLYRGLLEI